MAKDSQNLVILYDDVEITLGALATKTAVFGASKLDATQLNGFRLMKAEYWIDYHNKTADQGPIMVGLSFNHSVGEVATCIGADPQSKADPANIEEGKRPVWPLEMISYDSAGLGDNGKGIGVKGSFKPTWSKIEGKDANWFAYNLDADPLTTGGIVHIFAKLYGVFLND